MKTNESRNLSTYIKASEETELRELAKILGGVDLKDEQAVKERILEFEEGVDVLKTLMTSHLTRNSSKYGVLGPNGKKFAHTERGDAPLLSMTEALHSNDASVLFRRVISDVLLSPVETPYIGQDILAKKITVDAVRSVLFPAMGAIKAGDVSETGEYPEQSPSFTQHALELKVQRSGLKLAMSDDVIEDSMWDIFGLYVTMAANAMRRWKEQKIFNEALAKAHVVFNNADPRPAAWTTGLGQDQQLNGSLTFLDLLDCIGGVIANGYTPTDLVLHPLTWVMIAKDPRLLFQVLTNGNTGQTMPDYGLDAQSIQQNLPWGSINTVVSPQMPFTFESVLTTGIALASTGAAVTSNIADILVVDRQSSLLILQREEMNMEEFEHPDRDIKFLKVAERYAVGALDEGRGLAQIKNCLISNYNHKALYNLGYAAPI